MLWMFLIAGLIGIICGSRYRAPALIVLSFISLAWVFILLLFNGMTLGEAFVTAFLVTAILQLGYLLGAGFGNLWRLRMSLHWRGVMMSPRVRRSPVLNG
jgi:hypothetical protein